MTPNFFSQQLCLNWRTINEMIIRCMDFGHFSECPINLIQPLRHMSPKVKQQYLASLSGLPQHRAAESQEASAKFTGKYWRDAANQSSN